MTNRMKTWVRQTNGCMAPFLCLHQTLSTLRTRQKYKVTYFFTPGAEYRKTKSISVSPETPPKTLEKRVHVFFSHTDESAFVCCTAKRTDTPSGKRRKNTQQTPPSIFSREKLSAAPPARQGTRDTHFHIQGTRHAAGDNKQMGATITSNVGHGSQKRDEMNSLAVSYLGKPLHFLASLLWAVLSRLLSLLIRNRGAVVEQAATTFDKPTPPPAPPRQPLVRLKNLPQVSGRALLSAAEVRVGPPRRTEGLSVQQRCVVVARKKTCRLSWSVPLISHHHHHQSIWLWQTNQPEGCVSLTLLRQARRG